MARQDFRDVLGVLACPNGYSKSAISATMSSRFPIVLFTIRFNSEISKQFLPQDLDRSNITGIGLEGGTQMNDGGVVALQGFGTKTSELDSIPDTALRGLISGMLWNTAANRFLGDLIATKKFTKSNNDGSIVETLSILSNGVCIY
ncbi:hypothetical protein AX774_g5253 [Zancudomyces culisetae]|uniref:Uncharacterized protein n=1 Tax=Zancudomyces culisetae TaxID=1213189 RepID=A0A1R1PJZ7_ZANCU|nr:hypothetical protein AX774_g5253 [Zancudomyces culisetae]|eukprot:OMH81291.1 hypothetical protein AX774_g5253 [Zancudomyces culisetae]